MDVKPGNLILAFLLPMIGAFLTLLYLVGMEFIVGMGAAVSGGMARHASENTIIAKFIVNLLPFLVLLLGLGYTLFFFRHRLPEYTHMLVMVVFLPLALRFWFWFIELSFGVPSAPGGLEEFWSILPLIQSIMIPSCYLLAKRLLHSLPLPVYESISRKFPK